MAKKLTVSELAEHFEVTKTAVYLWIKNGLPYETKKQIGKKEFKVIDLDKAKKFLNLK